MPDKNRGKAEKKKGKTHKHPKTAFNNQWVSTGLDKHSKGARRDGPGGENGQS